MAVQIPYPLPAKQDMVNSPALERDFAELHTMGSLVRAKFPFGGEGWIAVRYDVAKSVLDDPRFGLEITREMGDYPRIRQVETGPPFPPSFVQYDPPIHTKKRSVLMKHLTVKRVRQLRPRVEALVESQLDLVESMGPPVDLSAHFAREIPVRVFADLIGAPVDEHDRFLKAARLLGNSRAETPEEAAEAIGTLRDYFAELVDRRKRSPGDDLISALILETETTGSWTEEELHGVGVILLLGAHDATSAMLGGIIEWLSHDRALYQQIRNDPQSFPRAFEEFVRFIPAGLAGTRSRIALEDVQVGEVLVKKGEAVLPIVHAANFDESAFENADLLDLDRQPTAPHLAFGFGPHACVGLQLARMEIDVAIRALVRRFTSIENMNTNPRWFDERLLRGPKEIRVAWEKAEVSNLARSIH